MTAILQSLERTILAGLVLLIAIIVVVGAATGQFIKPDHAWATFVMRWLHVISGIMWIGLLWYFNFVQIPTVPRSSRLNTALRLQNTLRRVRCSGSAMLLSLRSSPVRWSPG